MTITMDSPPTIHDLPPELLSKIFVSCVDRDVPYDHQMRVPITLGLVCKKWRETTLQTRDLWSAISSEEGMPHSEALELNTPALNRWIARSGDLPCYVQLVKQPGGHSTLPTILYPITHRIRVLDLILPHRQLQSLSNLFIGGFPRLETCWLELTEYEFNDSVPDQGFSLAACRILTNLDFTFALEEIIGDNDIMSSLPASLAHLRLGLRKPKTLLYILTQFPNLATFNLDGRFLRRRSLQVGENAESKVLYSHLLSLAIYFEEYDLRPILQVVPFPSLTSLGLGDLYHAEGILSLISKASPPLTNLDLSYFDANSDELISFLENSPTLTSFTLFKCHCFDQSLVKALTLLPDRQRQYLPRLEHLSMRGNYLGGCETSHKGMVYMVESRWHVAVEGCLQLRKVHLGQDGVVDTGEDPRVSKIKEEGLDILVG